MNNDSHQSDEQPLSAVLRSLDANLPPPDSTVLAALRERSAQTFANSAEATPPSGRFMFPFVVRLSAVVLATAVAIAVLISPWTDNSASAVPFSQVLGALREANTLHLRLVKPDDSAEVWIRRPGLVRREQSPERYEIAAGSRLWRVDESKNSVTTGDSPWFRSHDQQVDLVALLGVGVEDSSPLLSSRSIGRMEYGGRECLVYRVNVPSNDGKIEIEALADAATLQLAAIIARPAGAPRDAGPPLAELQLVAFNAPADDEKFVVAKTLTEDGRIGTVSDAQGVAVVRPMLAKRWTPTARDLLLKPGDWLRTELRGANALKVKLSSDTEITLGPGSLLECISPTEARLHTGIAQVNVTKKDITLALLGPHKASRKFTAGKQLVRVDREEALVDVPQQPTWLAGFEGSSNNESLGSLIVNLPDGRNEPLTVGYHKVKVEIRDQIARTTIEESFVNRTDSRLEGTFHFPLPQDASISGFGMWIGNDLVEADIVEKQRAREIYETILREKRDPGLLEWTGGNLFKARVFPIEPRSEKRIKIVYTQVLPLRHGKFHYTYGLRSDMLRTTPLRELSLDVTVNSALSLKSIACPTHTSRIQQTEHSGHVEFAAQEYTPTRDFEVVCEVNPGQADVVVVPHRRGSDGYFLLQITPPGGEGKLERDLLPDGKGITLTLLCDTSMSMDSVKRKEQADVVSTIINSLGDADRFQLGAADVGSEWAFKEPVAASAENRVAALSFLEKRLSLGWTNLDRAFADALKKSPDNSHIIYVGDGLISAGDTDSFAFVKRLTAMFEGQQRSLHGITVGNTNESAVMRGIARAGSGSVRAISGERTAQVVATELLRELTQPGLRDLKIEFRGLKVAAVYPEHLSNIADGTQQIVVGRYLPEGADQQGEVIVTGMRGKEKVRYVAKVKLKDAEEGNSFIPRLWARGHLDYLLAQGSSQETQDSIIALSEEFHIITPYTSLLVLESDADRERFKVQRRYEMRDGERFFLAGRENANFELLQQQMKRAGDWRIDLRRQVLRDLARLGRNPRMFERTRAGQAVNGPFGGGGSILGLEVDRRKSSQLHVDGEGFYEDTVLASDFAAGRKDAELAGVEIEEDEKLSINDFGGEERKKELAFAGETYDVDASKDGLDGTVPDGGLPSPLIYNPEPEFEFARKAKLDKRGELWDSISSRTPGRYGQQVDYNAWVGKIFPELLAPPAKPIAADAPGWPAEAIALSKSLSRAAALRKMEGGVELRRTWDTFDPRWKRRSSHNAELTLYSPSAWLRRTLDLDDHTLIEYCDAKERGIYSLALLLGRTRASVAQELDPSVALSLMDMSLSPLHEGYRHEDARVEDAGENRKKLILKQKSADYETHFIIDTMRHVVIRHESHQDGKLTGATTFEDFVEIGGTWWAKKLTSTNAKGETIATITCEIQSLAKDKFAERFAAEQATKTKVQFLHLPGPKFKVAQQKIADGSAGFDDLVTMMMYDAWKQQWEELEKHLAAAERLAAGKPGVRWLRTVLLPTMRRNEEARQRLLGETRELVKDKRQDELWQAEFLIGQARNVTSSAELLEFIELLKPVYDRQPAELFAIQRWQAQLLGVYQSLNRQEDALALSRTIAEAQPWAYYTQVEHARRLVNAGQPGAAIAWLRKEVDHPIERERYEDEVLRSALSDTLRSQTHWAQLLKFTTEWVARNPEYSSAYGHHLSALIYNDKLAEAYKLVEQWLKENRIEGKLSPGARARLEAAISFAQGNGHSLSFYRMDPRWIEPLAETARFFLTHKHHFDIAQRIVNYGILEDETGDRLRGYFLAQLQNSLPKLTPDQIVLYVNHAIGREIIPVAPINGRKRLDADEVPDEVWKAIADQLYDRWSKETDKQDRQKLSEALVQIYTQRFREAKYLAFLRERIETDGEQYKTAHIHGLFHALLAEPWTDALEQETLALVAQFSDSEEPGERLAAQVQALYRWTDAMVANRQAAEERKLGDMGGVDKLTRAELAKKKAEFKKAAQIGVAARLGAAAEKDRTTLFSWMRMEQAWLDVQLDQRFAQVEEQCWKILGEAPPKVIDDPDEVLTQDQHRQQFLEAALRQRALISVMNLATRKSAQPATIGRIMKYIDAGIAQGGDNAAAWRSAKFRLLVALDRADDLDRELRTWIRDDVSTAPWRMMLAHLLAERGQIDEAIRLMEAAEKDKLLTPADYRLLADWYLVRDRREEQERAKIEAYKQMPEYYLSNACYRIRERWTYRGNDRPVPSELDETMLLTFKALFEKSAQPEQYLSYLRDVYAACRDFRLLNVLPDSVLGRSPQQVYAFLIGVQSNVLGELRNEAAADEILARIKQLRTKKRTATDLRALDLLEAMVERRSADVLNQPGPHVEACLAALQRAFDRAWTEGEPRLMASFLYNLRTLKDQRLIDEQIRELRALQKLAPPQSRDQLLITIDLCNLLFWNYGRQDEAIREMETVVRAYTQANEGQWPYTDNDVLGDYVRLLQGANRHAAGEEVLQSYLAKSNNDDQRRWLRDHLLTLYNHALEHKGATSLGSGETLLKGVVAKALKQIEAAADERERYLIVNKLVQIFDTAHRNKISGNAPLVRQFAFEVIPPLLKQQQDNYRNTATEPIRVIADVLGNKAVVQYLIERIERYPERFEIGWNNSWSTFGHELATRRLHMEEHNQSLGELEPRLLELVISELKRDLRTGQSHGAYIYNWNNYFWKAKKDDFAKAANEVYAEQKKSGRRVLYIADYFWRGLIMHERAIEILLIAHRDGVLDERGQFELVEYLLHDQRFAEAIPVLESLSTRKPDNLGYRTRLMLAYFKTKRGDQLRELHAQTAAHFHKEGRWTAANIAEIARACLQTEMYGLAANYYQEAITLYQRQRRGASVGDATLSSWYQDQARAYSALNKTKDAVTAASGAIVCWGPMQTERKDALATLKHVLGNAQDLEAYVKSLDAETAKTGQDSPILRKAVGQVYQDRGLHDSAIAQFQLALALQSNDKEVHEALIKSYDATSRHREGTLQLLKLIDLSRHELARYQELALRFKNEEAEAERAATSIIEAAPGEAENHQAMAELRQQQNRWDEAIPHWMEVAKLRRLEPTGLLGLASAQLHEKKFDDARQTIKNLQQTEWPSRFEEPLRKLRELEEKLPK